MDSTWNDTAGDWQGLHAPSEALRYQRIASLIGTAPRVLDVGCGAAILHGYLPRATTYCGIEPSRLALLGAPSDTRIIRSTAEAFDPGVAAWDVIVWNEVLYYCPDPVALLDRYQHALTEGGRYVVSIYQKSRTWRGWLRATAPSNRETLRLVYRFFEVHHWRIHADAPIRGEGSQFPTRIVCASPH